ncbi:MAG: hypothetical protein ACTSRZ_02775 [Promethearchaeota archaeon]
MIEQITSLFNILQISPMADFAWNLSELMILILFIIQGIYFFNKFLKERRGELKSLAQIDFGYSIFFFMSALNQLIYLMDANIFGWFESADFFISHGSFHIYVYITSEGIGLKNQIVLMIVLFFYSLVPITYPLEKYVQQKEKLLKFKFGLIMTIILTILYVIVFVLGRYLAPGGFTGSDILWTGEINTIIGNIINIIVIIIALLSIISLFQLLSNFVAYYLELAKKSPKGPLKTKALAIFFGFILFYGALVIGNGLKPDLEKFANGWMALLGPIGFVIGNFVLIYGFNKKVV